jgi:MFS family permease
VLFRSNRSRILTIGVSVWSVLTALSGMAQHFWQMIALRLTVGVGEASCAPASNSLIGDLFPPATRARAMSIFMLGLPLGNAACLMFSGMVAEQWGWRAAFYVALVPGLMCAVGAAMLHEPKRGSTEIHDIGALKRDGSPYKLVLSIPTMRWIIALGALHNFNMYAIGGFLAPLVMRYHGADVQTAGYVSMAVYGLAGVPGMILGGLWGDAILRRRRNGRMLLASCAIALSVPLMYFALEQPKGAWLPFSLMFGAGCTMMYVYYATVYSTIQDVIEPSLRATAMALYFCAMYIFGGALGPTVIGKTSDYIAQSAAASAGVELETLNATGLTPEEKKVEQQRISIANQKALEPYRADGLNGALYLLPLMSLLLAGTLFAGTRTVARDAEKLQHWMRESAATKPDQPEPEPLVT